MTEQEPIRFRVKLTTPYGDVNHVVKAATVDEATGRVLRAHPKGQVVDIKRMADEA